MNKPHDRLFRKFSRDTRVAKEFCTQFLPPAVQKQFDISTLRIANNSFIEANLKELISDVIFSFTKNNETNYVYTLIEHQSRPDRFLPLRISRYMFALMQEHVRNTKEKYIPLVYPMVFYHGKPSPYPEPRLIHELFHEDERKLGEQWLLEPFHVVDLQQIPDEKLREFTWSGIMAFVLKHRENQNFFSQLQKILPNLQKVAQENATYLLEVLVEYAILQANEKKIINLDEVITFFNQISEEIGDKAMTLAERFVQQGKAQGRLEGILEGEIKGEFEGQRKIIKCLLAKGYDISLIREITEISEIEIRKMLI